MKTFENLSTRVKKALKAKGIRSLEEMGPMTDREIEKIQGIGRKGLREIRLAQIENEIPIPGAYL